METSLRRNNRYQILTPSGWSDFSGISKSVRSDIVKIVLDDGITLKGTSNHRILNSNNEFIELSEVRVGMVLKTKLANKIIIEVSIADECTEVYDAYNVVNGHQYFSNKIISHNCNQYLGSSGTLIAGWKLQQLVAQQPVFETLNVKQYNKPEKNRTYVGIVDVSRGKGLDYSTLQVIDVTEMPYKQSLTYRDNMITPADFAELIHRIGIQYNNCAILIEVNDIGQQVAETLYFDFEYSNMMFSESAGKSGKRITQSYKSNSATDKGIRTTKSVKSIGCSMLKLLIEQDQLIINDYDTIQELSTFSKKNQSYQAEPGCHDDLVMCLVLFGYLSEQPFFKQLTDINTLLTLKEFNHDQLENELLPFGFINDGIEDTQFTDFDRDRWMIVDQNYIFNK